MRHLFCRKNDELRKEAVDALCCLAQALGEDFTIFIPSIRKLLVKHRMRVLSNPVLFKVLFCPSRRSSCFYRFDVQIVFFASIRTLKKLKVAYREGSH